MQISTGTEADYMLYNLVLCSDYVNGLHYFRLVRCNIELLYCTEAQFLCAEAVRVSCQGQR